MSGATAIEWAEAVWNPVTGCTRVSAGCDRCYAFALHDRRYAANRRARSEGRDAPFPAQYDEPFSSVRQLDARLDEPLRRRRPSVYFVNSMGDLFHERVESEFLDRVFAVMREAARHRFLVLTKRPARMRAHLAERGEPAPNVWLGVSAETQDAADERVPDLLAAPAALRFVSAEPLLGPVSLERWLPGPGRGGVDWTIAGGESGRGARPCDAAWVRSLLGECAAADTPVFVKQLGAQPLDGGAALRLRDRKGGDPEEWPADLRVRAFPAEGHAA